MGLLFKDVEMTIKTPRSKAEVMNSLEEIVTFKGNSFKMPIKIFGNKLFVKRKYIVGTGMVTNDHAFTFVKATLRASGQLQAAFVLSLIISMVMFITAFIGIVWGKLELIPFMGMAVVSLILPSVPQIFYFYAIQLKKESIENLVLHGD